MPRRLRRKQARLVYRNTPAVGLVNHQQAVLLEGRGLFVSNDEGVPTEPPIGRNNAVVGMTVGIHGRLQGRS